MLKHHLHSALDGKGGKKSYIGHIHTGTREKWKGEMKTENRNAGGGVWARLYAFIYRILSTAPYNRKWVKVAVCIFLYIFTHKLKNGGGRGKVGAMSLGMGNNW